MDSLLKYWFWLGALTGIDPRRAKMLLDEYENPYEIFRRPPEAFRGLDFINDLTAAKLADVSLREGIEERMAAIAERGIEIVPMGDGRYPSFIMEIDDPPPVLFMRGAAPIDSGDRPVAVVGSRHPTSYGVSMTKKLVAGLAAFGFTIVSGMAMGIDAAAHKAALDAGAKTAAFLGCGVDKAYPPSNWRLMDEILSNGSVYSEYMPGSLPFQQNFPQRNRLISGASLGVVVVEAGERSGALITARMAGEQGRDVFAVPGNVTSPLSKGTNMLLRDGALFAANAEDVVFALNPHFNRGITNTPNANTRDANMGDANTPNANTRDANMGVSARTALVKPLDSLDPIEKNVAALLRDHGPQDADAIAARCAIPAGAVGSAVVTLEIKGFLRRIPGGVYEFSG